ncbi:MAG: Trk family potassium uptake protein [Chloroflexi bacterium]|nr:Trk family potassium uptake protein [Chloroflexota bacterium]
MIMRGRRSRVISTLSSPLPQVLRGSRRRELSRPIPWPVLSVVGFTVIMAVGAALLSLPMSSVDGRPTPFIDAAFTAVSAVTVTGLTVVDTADHWTGFGRWLILGLIQIGGLGFMTATTIFVVLLGFHIGVRGRALAQEDLASSNLSSVRRFVLSVAAFMLIAEALGFGLLYIHFRTEGNTGFAVTQAVFHSVSAFNNAGFDIRGGFRGLTEFSGNYLVVLVVAALIILGGIGFATVSSVVNLLHIRRQARLSLNAKVVLMGTLILLVSGTVVVLGIEYDDPATLGPMSWGDKALNSFFLSVSARTAGYNTFATSSLMSSTLFFVTILMFIGTAAGSTGGGVKVNTFTLIVLAVVSSLRGHRGNEAFGRRIPDNLLQKALTIVFLAMAFIAVVTMVLITLDDLDFLEGLFLTVSASATVGLATVDPGTLSAPSKALLMVSMFVGKLGIPLLVLTLARLEREKLFDYPEEGVSLG